MTEKRLRVVVIGGGIGSRMAWRGLTMRRPINDRLLHACTSMERASRKFMSSTWAGCEAD